MHFHFVLVRRVQIGCQIRVTLAWLRLAPLKCCSMYSLFIVFSSTAAVVAVVGVGYIDANGQNVNSNITTSVLTKTDIKMK